MPPCQYDSSSGQNKWALAGGSGGLTQGGGRNEYMKALEGMQITCNPLNAPGYAKVVGGNFYIKSYNSAWKKWREDVAYTQSNYALTVSMSGISVSSSGYNCFAYWP